MNEKVKKILGRCLSIAFGDPAWQFFGFRKRPRHGAFWQKFRPEWRVALERRLFVEIFLTNVAAYVKSGSLDSHEVGELTEFMMSDAGVERLLNTFGYKSSLNIKCDVMKYAEAHLDKWAEMLTSRLQIDSIADKNLYASVLEGCLRTQDVAEIIIYEANSEK